MSATDGTFRYRRPPAQVKELFNAAGKADEYRKLLSPKTPPKERMAAMRTMEQLGGFFVEKTVPVLSLRDHPLSLEEGGAVLVDAPSAVDFASADFRKPIQATSNSSEFIAERTRSQQTYYREVETLARKMMGADVVHAFCLSHILRESAGSDAVGQDAGPIMTVHNDFTEEYGDVTRTRLSTHPSKAAKAMRSHLKQLKGLSFTEEDLKNYRIVVLNTWRPITPDPLKREPLAVCDNRTIAKRDLLPVRTTIGQNDEDPDDDFRLEVYMSTPNPDHQWHYVPDFTSQELLIFKTYDSEMNPFVPTMHSAFNLHIEDAPARESCEARVICLMRKFKAKL